MGLFNKVIKEIGNVHQAAGHVLSGGLISNPYRSSRGFTSSRPTYRSATYGRPQASFSKQDAMNSFANYNGTLAPTNADLYQDVPGSQPSRFMNSFNGGDQRSFPGHGMPRGFRFNNVDMNATAPGTNSNGLRWTDNNGASVGGKQGYRYSWEQPSYQAQSPMRPQPTAQEFNVLNQTPPDVAGNAWNVNQDVMPTMNSASEQGFVFGSNPNATGAFDGNSMTQPVSQPKQANNAPATLPPMRATMPLSAFYNY